MVSEKNQALGQSSEEQKQNPARDQRVPSEVEVASIHTCQCDLPSLKINLCLYPYLPT